MNTSINYLWILVQIEKSLTIKSITDTHFSTHWEPDRFIPMVNGNTAFIMQRETVYCHAVTIFIVNPCLYIDEKYPLPLGQLGTAVKSSDEKPQVIPIQN